MDSVKRRPLGAKRDHAERYLLISIATFTVTVAGVRWYLDLAGYPTIGGGGLHFAHALWGGLALLLAATLPMLFVGRRSMEVSAVLTGVGVGLFIDEVGKFLTTSNDYFFAPAAPIIYGSILLLILVWLLVRRQRANIYDATQAVVEALRDGVDGKLTEHDRSRIIRQLQASEQANPAEVHPLSDQLLSTLESSAMDARLAEPGWIASGQARRLLERILSTRVERWLIIAGLVWATLIATVTGLVLAVIEGDALVDVVATMSAESGRLEIPTQPIWVLLALSINVVVGIASVASILILWRGRPRLGLNVALGASLISLVAGGLIGFYAVQLAALTSTLFSLLLLGLIIDQRIRVANAAEARDVDGEAT